jgi:hypothetical protein
MEFTIIAAVTDETLAYDMAEQLSHEDLMSFIQHIDMIVGDWEFTEMIYEWAREQHGQYLAEKDDIEREMRYL